MKQNRFVMIVLTLIVLAAIPPVLAQQDNWVTVLSIRDLTDNYSLKSEQPLLAGHGYNITMSIRVPFSLPTSDFRVSLDGQMQALGNLFWSIATTNYTGYDPTRFTPGSRSINFKQVQGQFVLSALFTVPQDLTVIAYDQIKLRFLKANFQVVTVSVAGGSVVGRILVNVSDAVIEAYLISYASKSGLVSAGKIDKTYSQLVDSILQQSQDLYKSGLPEKASNLLNTLNPDAFPAPPNSSMVIALTIGVAALAVIVGIVAVLLLRTRTKLGYADNVIGGIQKELAGLEVAAAQYDKNLADKLKNIRNQLAEVL